MRWRRQPNKDDWILVILTTLTCCAASQAKHSGTYKYPRRIASCRSHNNHAPRYVEVSAAPTPLTDGSFETLAADLKAAPPGPVYVLFSSTEEDGERWCPPCAEIEGDVKRVFENGPACGLR